MPSLENVGYVNDTLTRLNHMYAILVNETGPGLDFLLDKLV